MSFNFPALWIVSGASQSGKTEFCCKLIKHANTLFNHRFRSFVWCYQQEQAAPRSQLSDIHNLTFHQGLPDSFSDFGSDALIVIDDSQQEASSSRAVLNAFTRGAHHDRQVICLVVQNLFLSGKYYRNLALNTHVLVLFRSLRDKGQQALLFRQISPTYFRELTRLFERSTSKPYSYFIVDCHPRTNPALRYRTCIFPEEGAGQIVFVPPGELVPDNGWQTVQDARTVA